MGKGIPDGTVSIKRKTYIFEEGKELNIMKSLAELAAIRDRVKDQITLRESGNSIRIVVGMGTCGIAAGARSVLHAFVEGIDKKGLHGKAVVLQSGCVGGCEREPVVEIICKGQDKVTYINMTAEKAERVLEEHVKGGKIVTEYTAANA